jgi:hypothetical protein
MPWYRKNDGEVKPGDEKKEDEDIEFKPEKLKEDIGKDLDERFTKFSTANDEKMKPLLTMAENIEKDRIAREERARKEAEKKDKDDNALTSEDFMLDPAGATKRAIAEGTSGLTRATMMLAARGNIRETLEDKEYYHGDFKTKVDEMIANQPLEAQCRPDVIENCYLVILAKNMKDIQEGKVKARVSGSTFDSGGTGGHKAEGKEGENDTLTADEKQAAAAMGINEKDWAKSRRELSFV